MHWATMLVLLILILISVQTGLVWAGILLGFVIVLWMMSRAGGTIWGGTKTIGSGIKGELDREYKTMESSVGKYPDTGVWITAGKKVTSKAGDYWALKKGPISGDWRTENYARRTHEKMEFKTNVGTAFGNACKSFLDACGKVFKK